MSQYALQQPFEDLIRKVGGSHRFQYLMFAVCLLKRLFGSMLLISPNFLFATADFICAEGENGTTDCQEWVCSTDNEYVWRSHLPNVPVSLSYEFGWYVCSRQWMVPLVQSMLYFGTVIGYLTVPYFADNFGRRRAEKVAWAIATLGVFIVSTSMSMITVGLGLFLCGMGTNTALNLQYSFLNELVVGMSKIRMVMWLQLGYSLALGVVAVLALLLQNWRVFAVFFLAFPIILLNFGGRWMEETPEFSYAQSSETLLASLNRIARVNSFEPLDLADVKEVLKNYSRPSSNLSMLSLCRYRSLRKITYCCGFVHLAINFAYDGTLYNLGRFGMGLYVNQMVISAAEIVAFGCCVWLVPRLPRKFSTVFGLVVCGLMMLGMSIASVLLKASQSMDRAYSELAAFLGLRFVLNCLWGVYIVYVTELFPREITSIAVGYLSMMGAFASGVSPYIRLATKSVLMGIMAATSFIAAGHLTVLHETKDQRHRHRIAEREAVV